MPDDIITLKLSREDIGQMIDGLSVRRDSWRETQKYLEGQEVDCIIEECSDSEEACLIADNYDRIIKTIGNQIAR
jgi:hypothetical protein